MVRAASEHYLLFLQIICDIRHQSHQLRQKLHYLYILPILKRCQVIGYDMLLVTELQLVERTEIKIIPLQRK